MPTLGKRKTATSSPSDPSSQPAYGARVVIAGLVALVLIFGASLLRFSKAAEVATAVGSVSGIVATLVGAYFGVRGATLAQSQSLGMMTARDTSAAPRATAESAPGEPGDPGRPGDGVQG
jgi:hypothetical protein